jgi:alpha-L-fucosidase
MDRRQFLAFAAVAGSASAAKAGRPLPSPRQLAWHKLETYAFLHFTLNTFTNKEWGYGDEDPRIFQPNQFDADAIVSALKDGGMRAVILTCKHHDGFCLWPTRTTDHNLRAATAFREGKGDIVRDLSNAARKQGLGFGVYLSPWDRNHPAYGTPKYVDVYRQQLRELLTEYGQIFEVWHDSANGGDGFYGGAKEKRSIDRRTYYDWPGTWDLVRKLQPKAVIFSDIGPDLRWVGNERGIAGETCWATYSPNAPDGSGNPAPGFVLDKQGTTGHRDGKAWMPAECDVSIRPGWFWHEDQNSKVKTPQQLVDLHFKSVGRGGSFLLNVPPDRRGLLHENDVASLKAYGRIIRDAFAQNHAESKPRAASNNAEWTAKVAAPFNVVRIREEIAKGQRVDTFAIDAWQGGDWKELSRGTSIGWCRLVRLPELVKTDRIRLRLTGDDRPLISEFGAYALSDS